MDIPKVVFSATDAHGVLVHVYVEPMAWYTGILRTDHENWSKQYLDFRAEVARPRHVGVWYLDILDFMQRLSARTFKEVEILQHTRSTDNQFYAHPAFVDTILYMASNFTDENFLASAILFLRDSLLSEEKRGELAAKIAFLYRYGGWPYDAIDGLPAVSEREIEIISSHTQPHPDLRAKSTRKIDLSDISDILIRKINQEKDST